MLVINLARGGRKNRPFYSLIVREQRSKRDSGIEKLGYYNPLLASEAPSRLHLNLERFDYWLSVGAKPSATVGSLYKKFTTASGIEKSDLMNKVYKQYSLKWQRAAKAHPKMAKEPKAS